MPVYSEISSTPASQKPKASARFGHEFSNAASHMMFYSFVYYSDDEGRTWHRSRNETFVLLDKGVKGAYAMGEPTVIELKDGRLLMLGRTNMGRVFRSFSEDRGETWSEAYGEEHRRLYGYEHRDRPLEIVAARVEAVGRSSEQLPPARRV